MFIVRESQPSDLEQILGVAKHLDSYNLPFDRDAIKGILAASSNAFSGTVAVQDRAFTFIVENTETGDVVGTSMVSTDISSETFIANVGIAYLYGMVVATGSWNSWIIYSIFLFLLLLSVSVPAQLRLNLPSEIPNDNLANSSWYLLNWTCG